MSDQYEVYALKYAQRDARARDHFVLGDMHVAQGDPDAARGVYERTLEIARSVDRTSVIERTSEALERLGPE